MENNQLCSQFFKYRFATILHYYEYPLLSEMVYYDFISFLEQLFVFPEINNCLIFTWESFHFTSIFYLK